MLLLDSDHLSVLWYSDGAEFERLYSRLATHTAADVFVSIVTIDEQLRGWLAFVKKASRIDGVVKGYAMFQQVLERFVETQVVGFDDAAADVFTDLRSQKIRIGTMDLRIASIAIANDLTLLTRNTVDFARVPNLRFEDWTAA